MATKVVTSYEWQPEYYINDLGKSLLLDETYTTLHINGRVPSKDNITIMIGDALRYNCTLTTVYISTYELGAVGIQLLAKAFEINTTLTSFELFFVKINVNSNPRLTLLAHALQKNCTLQKLGLTQKEATQFNGFCDFVELSALMRVFEQNTTLTHFGISCVGHHAPLMVLKQSLSKNTTLQFLDLYMDGLPDVMLDLLVETFMTYNTTVQFLGLHTIVQSNLIGILAKLFTRMKGLQLMMNLTTFEGVMAVCDAMVSRQCIVNNLVLHLSGEFPYLHPLLEAVEKNTSLLYINHFIINEWVHLPQMGLSMTDVRRVQDRTEKRNLFLRDNQYWTAKNHGKFPLYCHTVMTTTLLAATRVGLHLPEELWHQYIFVFLQYKNFIQ